MKFVIEPDIWENFPGIRFVVAVAKGVNSASPAGGPDAVSAIAAELSDAWQYAAAESARPNPQSHPHVLPWCERMKAVGAPRKKFPSSVEALLRRAGKSDIPLRIDPLVDFYNAISLRYIVPAGGFDIDALEHDLTLRFSRAGDTFAALDDDTAVEIPAGEVSYTDGSTVITRHFVWKQSRHTLLTPESRNIFFVSEILGELPQEVAEQVREAFATGLARYFGVDARTGILDAQTPEFEL